MIIFPTYLLVFVLVSHVNCYYLDVVFRLSWPPSAFERTLDPYILSRFIFNTRIAVKLSGCLTLGKHLSWCCSHGRRLETVCWVAGSLSHPCSWTSCSQSDRTAAEPSCCAAWRSAHLHAGQPTSCRRHRFQGVQSTSTSFIGTVASQWTC